MTAFVFHCESVLWGQVQCLSRNRGKVQLLDENCQEEEDFMPCNNFADATALSHSESHHLLPLQPVQLSAVSSKEALRVECRWIFPLLSVERDVWKQKNEKVTKLTIQKYVTFSM